MNKYFYYNYMTVAFANILVFVPYVLIQNRYNGTVMAIGISFIIGMLTLFLFTRVTEAYPNKDIMQILKETNQTWFIVLFVSSKTILSILSTILVVGGYTIIISRYLNPEGNLKMVLILVLLAVGYAATRDLLSIAYLIEFMMVVTIPFIIFIMIKTFSNPIFTIDTVLAIGQHYTHVPNLLTIAAATFMFSGFSHVALFNQYKNKPLKFKYSWPAPFIVLITLVITIIVPIGIMGSETAAEYLYVWTVATDATQMSYGFIERMMFIFIIVLLSIAITYAVTSLSQIIHVGKGIIIHLFKPKQEKTITRLPYYIYTVVAVIIFTYLIYINDFRFEQTALWYLTIHFFVEVLFTLILFFIIKVKGKSHETKTN